MIPKINRFTAKNFEFLRRKMRPFRHGPFLFFNGNGRDRTRCAVVVSKKVEKSAVKRNRFRRLTYELFRKAELAKLQGRNTICLYNGKKIPKTTAEIQPHIEAYLTFIHQKTK